MNNPEGDSAIVEGESGATYGNTKVPDPNDPDRLMDHIVADEDVYSGPLGD